MSDQESFEGTLRVKTQVRIGFVGCSGTGKTTMARWVSETYGIPINPIGSRSVAKEMGFQSPYDVDAAGKRGRFQELLQLSKLEWEKNRTSFVSDRTYVDELAYTLLHDSKAVTEKYLANVIEGMALYTHVILFPRSVFQNLGDDPQRLHDSIYHEMFEMIAEAGLRKFPCRRHFDVVGRPDLKSRMLYIGRMIDSYTGVQQ